MIKNNFDDVYYPENLQEILYKNVDEKMVDHIRRANKDYLDTTAQTLFGESATYRELFENVEKYAKALKKYGVSKGDCVTLAMPNIPETIYYIYACNEIGATAYPIDPRSTFKNMVDCINNSKSCLFICEMGTYYTKVARYLDKLPVDNVVVVSPVNMLQERKHLNESKDKMAAHLYSLKRFYEDLKNSMRDTSKKLTQKDFMKLSRQFTGSFASEYEPDIPAIIVNTSGTTGNNIKGAMHSNRTYNLYTNEAQFVTDQLERGNTYYGYIPYFSMYGSGVGMHVALKYGIIIKNIPKFDGKKSLEEIIDSKASILVGVPTMIEKLTEMYITGDRDASHVKQYIVGGDNISPDKLAQEDRILMDRGMKRKLVYGYGATECMPVSTMCPDERSHLYGSMGIVYPMANIKIIDPETNQELEHGMEGEILVNNPTLMMGYLNNEGETNKVIINIDGKKYYRTGDRGYLTSSGHLYMTGRYKRMMKRPDGHQVSPIPIENAINSNEIVEDCAVVGLEINENIPGVIPTAFIELNSQVKSENQSDDVIVKIVAEETLQKVSGERESALAYIIVDKIPYTINGKIDFKKLEKIDIKNYKVFIIDDPVTLEYFANNQGLTFLKLNKSVSRALKKN